MLWSGDQGPRVVVNLTLPMPPPMPKAGNSMEKKKGNIVCQLQQAGFIISVKRGLRPTKWLMFVGKMIDSLRRCSPWPVRISSDCWAGCNGSRVRLTGLLHV